MIFIKRLRPFSFCLFVSFLINGVLINVLFGVLLLNTNAYAASIDVSRIQSVRSDAKVFAQSRLPSIQAVAKTDIEKNQELKKGLNYQGTDIPEKQYTDENMSEMAQKMKAEQEKEDEGKEIKANPASILKVNQKNRETHLEAIEASNLLDRSRHAQKNPREYADFLSGKYSDCEEIEHPGEIGIMTKTIHLCDEYVETTNNQCVVGRHITVDAKHHYKCIKELMRFQKNCRKQLKMKCEKKEGISDPNKYIQMGGIGGAQIVSQDENKVEYQIHRSESFSTGNGDSRIYTSTISFFVGNLDRIHSFSIASMNFNTNLMLKMNGRLVFSNGLPGDEMWMTHEKEHRFVTYSLQNHNGQFGRFNDYRERRVNEPAPSSSGFINLKPYLVANQVNTIRIQVVYIANGHYSIDFRVGLKTECSKWNEEWVESCY